LQCLEDVVYIGAKKHSNFTTFQPYNFFTTLPALQQFFHKPFK